MSSPLPKHGSDNSSLKQRKLKTSSLTNKSTSNLDTRSELADLIKRKAEISVSKSYSYYPASTNKTQMIVPVHLFIYYN